MILWKKENKEDGGEKMALTIGCAAFVLGEKKKKKIHKEPG